tara:strand:+ start:307 stop:1101 length:795 start_codon:yes stop_codon:yes gene_type:complete
MVEVKQSLLMSILDQNIDESLFWAFELFHSEYDLECVPYINNIFDKLYKNDNEDLIPFVEQITLFWNNLENTDDTELALLFGSYVTTLCFRPYNLIIFVKECLKVNSVELIDDIKPNKIIIHLQEKDILQYKTIINKNPTKVLQEACRFALRKNINELFEIELPSQEEIINILNIHWLYYAYKTTIWKDRIEEYNGVPNDKTKMIDFNNDKLYEEFIEKWYYDPEEQSLETLNNLIGITKQIHVIEFCKLYNMKIKTKKIKIQN